MLVITDENRLPEYGFRRSGTNNAGRNIWVLDFDVEDTELSLIVNPLLTQTPEHENEIVLSVNVTIYEGELKKALSEYGIYESEFDVPLETICQMMQDGVMKIMASRKAVA